MRVLLPLLLLALAVPGCATVRGPADEGWRNKGFEESKSTRETLEASFAARRIALVVGNNHYDDPTFTPLKWAENDAASVGKILEDSKYGGFDRVIYLLGESKARRDRILAELVSLKNDLRRQDSLVVYVSTHGTMKLDGRGEPQLFLVAADTSPSDLRGTAIELAELQRFFSEIRSERKALVLDACYNGEGKSTLQPTVKQRVARMEESPVLSRKVRLGEAESHLFASTFGRPAREDDALQHGVYTNHLLEAMTWNQGDSDANSDGLVTAYEAHDYARAKTIEYTLGGQIPEAYFRVVGFNDLALVGSEEDRATADEGLIYHYGDEESLDGATLLIDGREKGVFPGTFTVEAGRHRVKIVSPEGETLQDRVVSFAPYEPVAAVAVQTRPRHYPGFIGFAPRARFSLTPTLLPLVGRANVGVEVRGGHRFVGAVEGLTLEGRFAYAPHSARFEDGDSVDFQARHIVSGGVGVGYRALLRGAMLGVGYRFSGTYLTSLEGDSCAGVAACDAWLWGTHGIALEESFSLGKRWSLHLAQEVGITGLNVTDQGIKPGVDFGITVGVEVGL
ncbi:MAG: caspase family protein [Deltaproteobacteria bacterium]|nr:caspase family protein [Deltaproteobacteria bacterium]